MRYYFSAKIEKGNDIYSIKLPFNVWEVCRKMDQIKAELYLDNRMIECELIPENADDNKGNYMIHLTKEDVEGVNLDAEHKLLLHVGKTLIKVDQNSPYSPENPIREIDGIDIIIQPVDGTCGQACVAMLAGVTIPEACTVMGCREWQATMGMVISGINYYGIPHNDIIVYTQGADVTLPKCAVLMEKMGRFCHYLVYYDGKYYDPNDGVMTEYDKSKLLGYMEIYVNSNDAE